MIKDRSLIEKRRFRLRAFASFGLLWSFLVAAVSGVVMYFRPEGSIAAWTGWSFLSLDKKGWEGVHTLSVLFLVSFGVLHVVLNGKALWGYLRRRTKTISGAKVEFTAALLLVAVLTAGAVGRWSPLWALMDARGSIKNGSLAADILPPSPEAAERSLADLCAAVPVDLEEGLMRLARAGYPVEDPSRTLGEISKTFRTSPERLYRIVSGR